MVKTLIKQIKEYKKDSLLTMLFAALEVILEIIIPLLMASLIDKGIEAGNMSNVTKYGTYVTTITAVTRPPCKGNPPAVFPAAVLVADTVLA